MTTLLLTLIGLVVILTLVNRQAIARIFGAGRAKSARSAAWPRKPTPWRC